MKRYAVLNVGKMNEEIAANIHEHEQDGWRFVSFLPLVPEDLWQLRALFVRDDNA